MAIAFKPLPPLEYVREKLFYNALTGELHWNSTKRAHLLGKNAGSLNSDGYRVINFGARGQFFAHRLAWLLSYGAQPEEEIDHIDGNRLNNALVNLRMAGRIDQCRNRNVQRNNSVGLKGVRRRGNKWQARIHIHGQSKCLGVFTTPEAAYAAYSEAARHHFRDFAPLSQNFPRST